MADPRDGSALTAGPVTTVPEVIERLAAIRDCAAEMAPRCGIYRFSDLYLTITKRIEGHIRTGGFFVDDKYLARLDVVFANRYFDALRAWTKGDDPPEVWRVLFDAPNDGEITAIQLAGAGVNAHINLDLAVATVDTGKEMGDPELWSGSRREDYDKVNDVFAEEMDKLMQRLLDENPAAREPTHRLSVAGDVALRIVKAARHFAWDNAEKLWSLERGSAEWVARERRLDAVTAWVGRGLVYDWPG